MTLQTAFEEFYKYKLSYIKPKSAKNYYETLRLFVRYVGEDKQIEELTQEDVRSYQIYVNTSETLKDGTKNCYIRNLRAFIHWISDEYSLQLDYLKIRIPKMPKKDYRRYTDQEIIEIYDLCECSVEWISLRNKCILTLLLDTGLRRNEIRLLKKCDIDMENMILYVHGKGSKDRNVPFNHHSKSMLLEYWAYCPYKDNEYVFSGRFGGQLGKDAIKQFLKKLDKKSSVNVSSHRLRHNFATDFALYHLREYGVSCSSELAVIMGHEDAKTTEKYVHIAQKTLIMENRYSRMDSIFPKKGL